MRLLAAMSGGVDSAVATALAIDDGHEVVGMTMKQWDHPDEETRLSKGCSTVDAVADARRACDVLGIRHYTLDYRAEFNREVIDHFTSEYARGRTPNPCIRCNRNVRYGAMLDRAIAMGFDGIVTGHWARAVRDSGVVRLMRPRCLEKDQTYVLHAIGQQALQRTWWPLGDVGGKDDVRAMAADRGLLNAERPDSVEVCFVPEGETVYDIVRAARPTAANPGPVLDTEGVQVGSHSGIGAFTIGQRKGLGIALGEPRYVTRIDSESATVTIGTREDLAAKRINAVEPSFTVAPPADGERLGAVIRYQAPAAPGTVQLTETGFTVSLDEPVYAAAPGQSVVLYRGEEVVGGGVIESAG